MARYSPELLAALRYRYEQTGQPMNALAADFGIGVTTLQNLARKNGWTPRSQRMRECPPVMLLQPEADAASLPPPAAIVSQEMTPTTTLPLSREGSEGALSGEDSALPSAPTTSNLSAAERIEALVVKELEAEEAARAALGTRPRPRYDAERCARTLSVLTQTLERLRRLPAKSGGDKDDDPAPLDIDALREKLTRRINGMVESAIGRPRMALNDQMSRLTDDEVRELIQVGRERGMQALLQTPQVKEDDPLDGHARA